MNTIPFVLACELERSVRPSPSVVDLSVFTSASESQSLAEQGLVFGDDVIPVLPPDPSAPGWAFMERSQVAAVVLDDIENPEQAERLVASLPHSLRYARLIVRLTRGSGLHHAPEIVRNLGGRCTGIWYAPADLYVDYQDAPGSLFLYDNTEPRLASPAWTRSRLLTLCRAFGLQLWGQFDLTFATPLPEDAREHVLRLAASDGFDILVEAFRSEGVPAA